MIYLMIHLTVKDAADVPQVQTLLTEAGRLSRAEPGCERFEVYHSEVDPKVFFLCEHWTSQEAIDEHRKAQAYTTVYQPKVLPLVERVGHKSSLVE